MKLDGINIGVGITGSFCTYDKLCGTLKDLAARGANLYPILSDSAQHTDSRFGNAADFIQKITDICGRAPVTTIAGAEPLGPSNSIDILLLSPCTGNTVAKLANALTDGPVLMAAKGHLRNGKPLVISLSTNDALSMNLKNIGVLMNSKNIYFVPFGQDNYSSKPNSMISDCSMTAAALEKALDGEQLQPVILGAK